MKIDVYSDVICPWCLIGKHRLEKALAEFKEPVEVHWHAFELNPDMPKEGKPRDAYRVEKFGSLERSRQMDANMEAIGQAEKIPFRFDRMTRTPNTFDAHRMIWLAGQEGDQQAMVNALFEANFEAGEDVGDRQTLVNLAAQAGIEPERARAFLESDAGVTEVREDAQYGIRAGIQGVPFFIINDQWAVSGAQPPETLLSALETVRRESA